MAQRVLALLSYLVSELLGLQLGHSVRPSRLGVSQVTHFAKASCIGVSSFINCTAVPVVDVMSCQTCD